MTISEYPALEEDLPKPQSMGELMRAEMQLQALVLRQHYEGTSGDACFSASLRIEARGHRKYPFIDGPDGDKLLLETEVFSEDFTMERVRLENFRSGHRYHRPCRRQDCTRLAFPA